MEGDFKVMLYSENKVQMKKGFITQSEISEIVCLTCIGLPKSIRHVFNTTTSSTSAIVTPI